MKRSTALKFKKIISILFAILLIASLALTVACNRAINPEDEDDGDTDPAEDTEIVEVIKNGKFDQYNDTSATSFPVTPKNWSYSADSYAGTSAPITSGDYIRYGTISLKEELYNADPSKFQTSSMKNNNKGTLANPSKPPNAEDNDKVLMLQNIKPTAAKYKSTSISVPINSYSIISVYVKTVLVNESGNYIDALNALNSQQGATISITGGVEKPIILYGIETFGNWKEYQFIIEGSSVSNKNITLELGLGTGSPSDSMGYTEGFAFFANAKMEYITRKSFNEKNTDAGVNVITKSDGNDLRYDGTNYGSFKIKDSYDANKISRISYTFKKDLNNSFDKIDLFKFATEPKDNDDFTVSDNGALAHDTVANIKNSAAFSNSLKNDLEKFPFTDQRVIAIQKNVQSQASKGIVSETFLKVKEGEYYRISFWVKTSDVDRSGLNIYLTNTSYPSQEILPTEYYKNIADINTTTNKLSQDEKEKATNANLWDDWVQYSFYVEGGIFERNQAKEKNLALEIWLGSVKLNYEVDGNGNVVDFGRSLTELNETNFPQSGSYAMITGIEVEVLSRAIYSSASSAENSITNFSLSSRVASSSDIPNGSFSNAKASEANITDRALLPENFSGMYGLGANGTQSAPQGKVVSGIVNTNLWDKYHYINLFNNTLNALDNLKVLKSEKFNSLLMIHNKELTSYGYASDNITLSSNSLTEIRVTVKAFDLAKGSIYLVDKDGNRFYNYILNKYGEKVSPKTEKVYNPYYDEKYDENSENYKKPEADYDKNSAMNKLLRKDEKYVMANSIPVKNPYYEKDYDKMKQTEKDKFPAWKRVTEEYFVPDNNLDQIAQFINITAADSKDLINNGFVTFSFFIKTGNTSRDVKVELWNGEKYLDSGSDYTTTYSTGAVFFDSVSKLSITDKTFYEYFLNPDKKAEEKNNNNMYFMCYDLSGYDNMKDPALTSSDVTDDPSDTKEPSEFPWSTLLIIIPTCAMLIALVIIVIRKLMKNQKEAEQTVTEVPTYAREKINKKSAEKNKTEKEKTDKDKPDETNKKFE